MAYIYRYVYIKLFLYKSSLEVLKCNFIMLHINSTYSFSNLIFIIFVHSLILGIRPELRTFSTPSHVGLCKDTVLQNLKVSPDLGNSINYDHIPSVS